MSFLKNVKDNRIVLDIESTGCNSLDELIKNGWELVSAEGKGFYKLDAAEEAGYYEWSLKDYFDDFLKGTKNGTCFLSEDNAKKAVKYLRKLSTKDLIQAGDENE